MHVFLHTRKKGTQSTYNVMRDFVQMPRVGEYVSPDSEPTTPLYLVKVVVHTPHGGDMDAEVYAVEVDQREALAPAFDE